MSGGSGGRIAVGSHAYSVVAVTGEPEPLD
ncbi:MAG: hypothetical protein QOH71_972 [Blastocatellia bacterium]|jgi:hypothetical protein|nr:hypothetical protein [Blastocatellia bacterium]